jgi:hypothetical protein
VIRRPRRAQRRAPLVFFLALGLSGRAYAATFEVSSSRDEGEGSLRAAIEAANEEPRSRIVVRLGAGSEILVSTALPALTGEGTRLEGNGVTLREGNDCRREAGQPGCDGLVVRAADVVVRGVRVAGFTFDGIAVRGRRARGVHIEDIEAIDNLDDGVGVSEGASEVLVVRSLLMGNGFRTKGKGLLVFDDSQATLRDSVVVANRDGVTVSRGASATLEQVIVAGNYDKGVGVSAGSLDGQGVQVLANGVATDQEAAVPNADGLRVGLAGRATLEGSRLAGNGDTGVVVLDESTVTLRNCEVAGNRGRDTSVAPQARLLRQ